MDTFVERTRHRSAANKMNIDLTLITSLAATKNRWCRMRACILNPGLWNVSAGRHK